MLKGVNWDFYRLEADDLIGTTDTLSGLPSHKILRLLDRVETTICRKIVGHLFEGMSNTYFDFCNPLIVRKHALLDSNQ